mgnify:CR=1 FL=1
MRRRRDQRYAGRGEAQRGDLGRDLVARQNRGHLDAQAISQLAGLAAQLQSDVAELGLFPGILNFCGKGGGRPDFAQGGGGDPAKMDQAISGFYPLVEKALSDQ